MAAGAALCCRPGCAAAPPWMPSPFPQILQRSDPGRNSLYVRRRGAARYRPIIHLTPVIILIMRTSFFHHVSEATRRMLFFVNKISWLCGYLGFRQAMIGFQSANDHLSIMVSSMHSGNLSPVAAIGARTAGLKERHGSVGEKDEGRKTPPQGMHQHRIPY